MKRLIYIIMAITITFSSCNDNDTLDHISDNANLLDGSNPVTLKNAINVNLKAYPKLEMNTINCVPNELSDAILKESLDMVGSINYGGKLFHIVGDYNIHDCSYDAATMKISESFTAIFTDHEGDRLFINGIIRMSHDPITGDENLDGEWYFNSDSHKYAKSADGFVIISGNVDFNTGIKTFKGSGLL